MKMQPGGGEIRREGIRAQTRRAAKLPLGCLAPEFKMVQDRHPWNE
ncbi:hypothetical protein ACFL6M_06620 [Candidatus Eisenbacteria bacterium]|uniref:Uncharacterized protein n=1 Tax=Eiseniibacteriota bacterium TaxID=2212470 RepID=A0ABV6YLQ1_UNCEI